MKRWYSIWYCMSCKNARCDAVYATQPLGVRAEEYGCVFDCKAEREARELRSNELDVRPPEKLQHIYIEGKDLPEGVSQNPREMYQRILPHLESIMLTPVETPIRDAYGRALAVLNKLQHEYDELVGNVPRGDAGPLVVSENTAGKQVLQKVLDDCERLDALVREERARTLNIDSELSRLFILEESTGINHV